MTVRRQFAGVRVRRCHFGDGRTEAGRDSPRSRAFIKPGLVTEAGSNKAPSGRPSLLRLHHTVGAAQPQSARTSRSPISHSRALQIADSVE